MAQQLPSDGAGERPPPGAGCDASELLLVHAIYREDFERAVRLVREQEELQIVPVAGRVLTQDEWNEMRERAIREGKPSTMMIDLDRVRQQYAAEGREQEFFDALPTPVRLAFQLFGRRLADRHWRAIYGTAA